MTAPVGVSAPTPTARPTRWRSPVRVRVTAAAVLVGTVIGGIGMLFFLHALRSDLESALAESAAQQADSVVARLEAGASPQAAAVTGQDDVLVQVLDEQGRIRATDHPELTTPISQAPGSSGEVRVAELGDEYIVVARDAPGGSVVAGRASEQVTTASRSAVRALAVAVPIGIALLGATVWFVVGRALRPVESMRREAATITSEHLHRRLPVPAGADEIPLLAATLNDMLDRIDAFQRGQRRFVADASHELRSPLAVLRQLAEVARRHPDSTSVAALAEDVLAEEARMEGLVTALLTLARLDGVDPADLRVVDLDDAVHTEVDRMRRLHPGIVLDRHGVGAGQVRGDAVLLGRVVANLLRNAVRHARSTVTVTLAERDGEVELVVSDDGPGVPPDERERVFERFTRLDEARSRDVGGAGLGLAIVHDVVVTCGGRVHVEDAETGGARFVVRLPAVEPA
ncbi:sensor histidine kinase [Nocardioides sp.]|uniref:sensor histidine kinase n=1 Tax=Nocardioides sp. TaxID=35761 RepID=UPI0035175BB9